MVESSEAVISELLGEGVITEVIRPAAVVPELCARSLLVEMALNDVQRGGLWQAEPVRWARYDLPWVTPSHPGGARLVGTIQVAYGTPTRYEITIYRVTVSKRGSDLGWNVQSLCDEALGFGGTTLARLPRVELSPPPPPFRL